MALSMVADGARAGGIWLLLAAGMAAAAIAVPGFAEPGNLANVLRQASVLGVLAIGQTFVVVAGMIDLSVGMIAGLVVVLACWLLGSDPSMTAAVVPAMLFLGAGIGLANGLLVNRLDIHPLILTFGMLSILQGAIFTFTDRSVGLASPPLQALANGDVGGFPLAAILLVVLAIAFHMLLSRTRFGLHLTAAGGAPESARRAGLDVARLRLLAFVVSGTLAALAGLILAGRLGTGYPLAGAGLELDAIVAVVLGGVALSGGRGSVAGAIAGVLALSVLSNALNLLGVTAFAQMFVKGAVVVAAILVNQPARDE